MVNFYTSSVAKDNEVIILACGALAKEIIDIIEMNGLEHISLTCLPADLHNTPKKIPLLVQQKIHEIRKTSNADIFCAYGDCGTGGMLDKMLEKENVKRIEGPHCYSFFSGNEAFHQRQDEEFDAFYLTNFLAKQFDAFVTKPLGLDRHPELRDSYFAHYKKLVYLEQYEDDYAEQKAKEGADFLGLIFEKRTTGYGDLASALLSFEKHTEKVNVTE